MYTFLLLFDMGKEAPATNGPDSTRVDLDSAASAYPSSPSQSGNTACLYMMVGCPPWEAAKMGRVAEESRAPGPSADEEPTSAGAS